MKFKKGDRVRVTKATLQYWSHRWKTGSRFTRLITGPPNTFSGKVGEVTEVCPLQDLVWVRFKIKGIGRASFSSDMLEHASVDSAAARRNLRDVFG